MLNRCKTVVDEHGVEGHGVEGHGADGHGVDGHVGPSLRVPCLRDGENPTNPSSLFPLPPSLFLLILLAACNPFAPDLREGDPFGSLLGDQTTVEGFFTNFRNAYELRDLSLYEPLLDSSFVFEYFDFDAGIDREWGFSQELSSTARLFQNAGLIQLQWNQILSQQVRDAGRQSQVVRSFNLTISLEGGEVFRTDGNVNFLLVRPDTTAVWRLRRWRDESEL